MERFADNLIASCISFYVVFAENYVRMDPSAKIDTESHPVESGRFRLTRGILDRAFKNVITHMMSAKDRMKRAQTPSKFLPIASGIHLVYFVLLFAVYPIVTTFVAPSRKYDGFYLSLIALNTMHWIVLRGECCISYLEKLCFYEDYKLGSAPVHSWSFDVMDPARCKVSIAAMFIMVFVAVTYVVVRNFKWDIDIDAKILRAEFGLTFGPLGSLFNAVEIGWTHGVSATV